MRALRKFLTEPLEPLIGALRELTVKDVDVPGPGSGPTLRIRGGYADAHPRSKER
jgi:hypothetical protein